VVQLYILIAKKKKKKRERDRQTEKVESFIFHSSMDGDIFVTSKEKDK
jgi:hypothetical protein